MPFTRLLIFFIIEAFVLQNSYGANNILTGSRQAGMANASVVLTDVWSINHNQAGLARLEQITASIYHENKFNIPGLGTSAFTVAIPTQTGTISAGFSSFGNNSYKENKLCLAMGKKFGDTFSAGIQMGYLNTYIGEDYGKSGCIFFGGGFITYPLSRLMIGAHIFNPVKSKTGYMLSEKTFTVMRFGAGYEFGEGTILSAETEKGSDSKLSFKSGLEHCIKKTFYLRAGISTNPILNSFGTGYVFKCLSADIAFSKHQILGYSTQVTLSYAFRK